MNKNKLLTGLSVFAVITILLSGGFALGFNTGKQFPEKITIQGVQNMQSSSTSVDFATFWQAWQTVNDLYLRDKSVSDTQKVQGAINGMVNSLGDPYTEYFAPADSQKFQQDVQGN